MLIEFSLIDISKCLRNVKPPKNDSDKPLKKLSLILFVLKSMIIVSKLFNCFKPLKIVVAPAPISFSYNLSFINFNFDKLEKFLASAVIWISLTPKPDKSKSNFFNLSIDCKASPRSTIFFFKPLLKLISKQSSVASSLKGNRSSNDFKD